MKDVQATGEAFSPQKRTSSSKHRNFSFLFFWVIFALLNPDADPDPACLKQCGSKRIRIHNNQWLTIKLLILPYTSIFWLALLKTVAGRGFLKRETALSKHVTICDVIKYLLPGHTLHQCSGWGSGSVCFWASWIRMRRYLYGSGSGSGSFHQHAKKINKKILISTI